MLIVNENSYIDVDYADSYMDNKLYSDEWDALGKKEKESALIEATSEIDNLLLTGVRATKIQKLQFPRAFPNKRPDTVHKLSNDYIGYWYFENDVSDNVKKATCEEALAIIKFGNSARVNLQRQNVTQAKFGDVQEWYDNPKKLLSKEALSLMKGYLLGSVTIVGMI